MNLWLILAMAAGAFAARGAFLIAPGEVRHPLLSRVLHHLTPAILAALVAAALAGSRGAPDLAPRTVSVAVGLLAGLRTGRMELSIAAGMSAYYALAALLP